MPWLTIQGMFYAACRLAEHIHTSYILRAAKVKKRPTGSPPPGHLQIPYQSYGTDHGFRLPPWSGALLWHTSRHSTDASERTLRSPATPPGSADEPVPKASAGPAGAVRCLWEGAAWRLRRCRGVSELGRNLAPHFENGFGDSEMPE